MSEFTDELLADAKDRMTKSVDACSHELATVRTGRASPHLLDRVAVDYYGTETPLRQLSQIAVSSGLRAKTACRCAGDRSSAVSGCQ